MVRSALLTSDLYRDWTVRSSKVKQDPVEEEVCWCFQQQHLVVVIFYCRSCFEPRSESLQRLSGTVGSDGSYQPYLLLNAPQRSQNLVLDEQKNRLHRPEAR